MEKNNFMNDLQVMPPICGMGCAVLSEPFCSIWIGGLIGALLGVFFAYHNPKNL